MCAHQLPPSYDEVIRMLPAPSTSQELRISKPKRCFMSVGACGCLLKDEKWYVPSGRHCEHHSVKAYDPSKNPFKSLCHLQFQPVGNFDKKCDRFLIKHMSNENVLTAVTRYVCRMLPYNGQQNQFWTYDQNGKLYTTVNDRCFCLGIGHTNTLSDLYMSEYNDECHDEETELCEKWKFEKVGTHLNIVNASRNEVLDTNPDHYATVGFKDTSRNAQKWKCYTSDKEHW